MKYSSLIISLILVGCPGGTGPVDPGKPFNVAPEGSITSPSDGEEFTEGIQRFQAVVSDGNHEWDELTISWKLDDNTSPVEGCAELTTTDGTVFCDIYLTEENTKAVMQVTDPNGEAAIDEVTFTVTATIPPTAEITSPEDGSTYYANQLIDFTGVVSDTEDTVTDLNVAWSSNQDGDLNLETTINSDGTVTASGNLTPGDHNVTMTVTDSNDKTDSDVISLTILEENTNPTCSWTQPADGDVGLLGASVSFKGTVGDAETDPNELLIELSSSIDGVFGNPTADTSGNFSYPYSDLSSGTHTISLKVEDDGGEVCISNIEYVVNTAPQIVLNSPTDGDTYQEGDSVSFSAVFTDAEDPASQLTTLWESDIDGVLSQATPDSTGSVSFTKSNLTNGTHSVSITATDTDGLFTVKNIQLTINGAPTQPTVTITPDPANTSSTLSANATGSVDPDGQTVSYTYEWLKDGVTTAQTGQTVVSSLTAKGDVWTVRATPTDGSTTGPYGEASITIANTEPTVSNVSISPNSPAISDTLTCSYVLNDADGDTVTETIEWELNGAVQNETSASYSGAFSQNDTITCRVTPNDGTVDGAAQEASVTIGNTTPTITSVTLSPTSLYTNDDLTATVVASDADGDTLSYTFDWYVDSGAGALLVDTVTQSAGSHVLDGATYFDRDDSVYVVVTVEDGLSSANETSSSVTIMNTAPVGDGVAISPASPIAGVDDLMCVPTATDADGDTVTFTYSWTEDGQATSFTTDTIPASETDSGEVWVCTATPSDGTDTGADLTISVTIDSNDDGAIGTELCASAGTASNSSYSVNFCLSPLSQTVISTNSSWSLEGGSHFTFNPGN